MDKNMPSQNIIALSKWAQENSDRRFAFIVCGELNKDGIKTISALMGTTANIAKGMSALACEKQEFKDVIKITADAIDNPILRMLLKKADNSDDTKSSLLKDILARIADKICKK